MASGQVARVLLVGFLTLTFVAPLPVWSAALSLGTARGVRSVELSLDGAKSWLPVGGRVLPLMDGTQVRSANGGAVLDFGDGSRVRLLPFSVVRLRDTGAVTEVSLVCGRLTFQLAPATRVELRTPSARLEAVRTKPMAGELFVAREGTTGLKMSQGTLQVRELAGSQPVRLASTEPVFLPKRPATSAPLFSVDGAAASAPAGAKAVFGPTGDSLGYLRPDAQLVVHPGYTADLTQSFAPKAIQLAMAKVPEQDRQEAMPVFDVNGGYLGYLAGPVFYAQAVTAPQIQLAQVPEAGGTILGMSTTTFYSVLGGTLLLGGGLGGAAASGAIGGGGGGTGTVATALRPQR